MPEMTVRWEITVDAESPEEAARVAREIQLDPESTATVFEVEDAQGHRVSVDLAAT
jgi:hypothetical protein